MNTISNRLGQGLIIAVLSMTGSNFTGAQAQEKWDVTVPRGNTREISFTTEQGTWMSVDISPDSSWVVFDLLGHIYRLPVKGGQALSLTQNSGMAMNTHPRISPDGQEIAFVSDRCGQDNLWVMAADGSSPKPVFADMNARVAEPTWSPDGRQILVTRREKSPTGFYRTHDVLWMFPRTGGKGFEVVRLGSSGGAAPARSGVWSGLDRAQWPSFTPDGRHVYFHSSTFAGADRRLRRVDLETGRIDSVTEGKDRYLSCCGRPAYPRRLGEVSPEVSPDGRWLAFARKLPGGRTSYRGKEYVGRTALWLRDLETGSERIIMDPISNTLAEHHPSWHTRVLPGYSWASDSQSIVLSQGGRIRRLWIDGGRVETIPFQTPVQRTISEAARGHARIDDSFRVRAVRWPVSSPDGKQLVFEAVGQLWLMRLPDGEPRPLTTWNPDAFQLTPDWSPDGASIVYATWQDEVGGHLWRVSSEGGKPERLTELPGSYLNPSWAGDGQSIAVSRWPAALTPRWFGPQWELIRITPGDGSITQLTDPGLPPQSSPGRGNRLFHVLGGRLRSVDARGREPRTHALIDPRVQAVVPSPDGRWLAVEYQEDVYLVSLPAGIFAGGPSEIDLPGTGKRLSLEGGRYPHWRSDKVLEFVSANRYITYNVDTTDSDSLIIDLELPRDRASGTIALKGARIITLDEGRVIEGGTILVSEGRITCVGECEPSASAEVLDLKGKTIMPGWVDVHAHHLAADGPTGIIPQHRSTSAQYLAYGVTTVHDPAAPMLHTFSIGELIEAGRIVGPRSFSTGTILTCGPSSRLRPIQTFEDARQHVNRLANLGAISIKDYKQCTRIQRTWLAEAARRRGVTLTSEGSDLDYFLGLVMTGHAGWEHPVQFVPIYNDVASFFGQARAHYSAQLLMSDYPVGNAIEYWYGANDLWQDSKLMHWSPWQETASRRSFVKKPAREFMFPILAEGAADMKRAGAYIAVGAHGEQDGLGTHWEAWGYAYGLTPMETLEAASLGGSHFLGLEEEIGSVEVGKLADLVVLHSNPLDNIRNTTDIVYVMKSGRLYEGDSLDELWPRQKPYGFRPWLNEEVTRTDLRPDDFWDEKQP